MDYDPTVCNACYEMPKQEMVDSLKQKILPRLHLDLDVRRARFADNDLWTISPSYEVSRHFLRRHDLGYKLRGKTKVLGENCCYGGEKILEIVLCAEEISWEAQRVADRQIGTIVMKNPFFGCKSLAEALVKSDLLFTSEKEACNFVFVHWPT